MRTASDHHGWLSAAFRIDVTAMQPAEKRNCLPTPSGTFLKHVCASPCLLTTACSCHPVCSNSSTFAGGTKDTPQDEARRATFDATAAFPFAPSNRPSGLPMPPEPEASPAAPVDKGIWAAPDWLGAPRTALVGSTQQATTSGTDPALGSGLGSNFGQAASSGAAAGARPYCTSSRGALQCLEQLGTLSRPSVYEWVVQRQRQSSGVQQV